MAKKPQLGIGEFVALMALLMALVALAIDAMLPALGVIGLDLGVSDGNETQLIISFLFMGMAGGQLLFGPLSDSFGRKPAVYIGITIYLIGCLVSLLAPVFPVMLAGRVLQGFGAASTRVVTMAMIRDQYEGPSMARIMSLTMMIFVLVPGLAPSIGQGILFVANWRWIFGFLLTFGVIALVWFAVRQPETLLPGQRRAFSMKTIFAGVRETCGNRIAMGYTLTAALIFGILVGYLSSARQIFQDLFGVGTLFSVYFGVLALAIGLAAFVNSRLVMRFGMRRLVEIALVSLAVLSTVFFVSIYPGGGRPPLVHFIIFILFAFFCLGILFGNFNSMAVEPLGHIAGIATAVISSLQTVISTALGSWIGQNFDGTVLPVIGAFMVLSLAAIPVLWWTGMSSLRPCPDTLPVPDEIL